MVSWISRASRSRSLATPASRLTRGQLVLGGVQLVEEPLALLAEVGDARDPQPEREAEREGQPGGDHDLGEVVGAEPEAQGDRERECDVRYDRRAEASRDHPRAAG
jgi:hypothetical protein